MKAKVMAVVLTAMLLGSALSSQAMPVDGFPGAGCGDRLPAGPFPPMVARVLELNDAQKQQIGKLLKEEHEKAKAQHEKMDELRRQLRQAENAATFNEVAVRRTADALAGIEADGMVARVLTYFKVNAVLTPAQRALAEKMRPKGDEPGPPPFGGEHRHDRPCGPEAGGWR